MTRAARPGRARTLLLALASLAVAACKTGLEVPEGALVTCGSDADCPGGYICRSTLGRCVRPGGDVTAPELVTASLQVDPPLVGTATATVTVAFQVSEPLASDPVAFLRLSGAGATTRVLAVQSRDLALNRYVLSYSPAPASDGEGDVSFVATFIDAAGNEGHVELPRVAVFDFTAPRLARDTGGAAVVAVALTPPATSPRRDVDAITVGTRVRVDFAASEPLAGGAGSPVVKLASGGNAVTLTQLSGNTLSYVYETVMGAGFTDGPADLTAHLTDLAGNVADVPLATVQVKTQRPASPAVGTAGAVLFHRVPWGSEATGGAEAYYLRGAAGAVPASTLAVVYSDPTVISSGGTLVGREIARVAASVTGAFGGDVGDAAPFPLYMGDSPDVYVAAVDGAGNVSDADGDPSNGVQAALVRDVAWTATMLGKIPGRVFPNPHAFEGRQVWTPTLAQRGSKPAANARRRGAPGRHAGVGARRAALAPGTALRHPRPPRRRRHGLRPGAWLPGRLQRRGLGRVRLGVLLQPVGVLPRQRVGRARDRRPGGRRQSGARAAPPPPVRGRTGRERARGRHRPLGVERHVVAEARHDRPRGRREPEPAAEPRDRLRRGPAAARPVRRFPARREARPSATRGRRTSARGGGSAPAHPARPRCRRRGPSTRWSTTRSGR